MSIPQNPVRIPTAVASRYGNQLICLWQNLLGGLTFRAGPVVIKWSPWNPELSLAREAERTRWGARWIPAPEVLDYGSDEEGEWMVSKAIAGDTTVAPRWLERPEVAVPELGRSLRRLHESLPVNECPWRWDAEGRLANLKNRGGLDTPPPVLRSVVCHADACSPNTLLNTAGVAIAYVDLGDLGVADFWSDLAVAAQSAARNFGRGWDEELVRAYGVPMDLERIRYYQQLWDAG